MNIWTTVEEAENLGKRFQGVNRKEFAALHSIPGGDNMIYQHITARRPISREAAIAYAKAFDCGLEEISPRVAAEVLELAAMIGDRGKVGSPKAGRPSSLESLRPECRALVHAIIEADRAGLAADAFNVLQEALRLFRGSARPRAARTGVEDPYR